MQGLCAEKKAIGPCKQFDCSTLQPIADQESANRLQRPGRTSFLPPTVGVTRRGLSKPVSPIGQGKFTMAEGNSGDLSVSSG